MKTPVAHLVAPLATTLALLTFSTELQADAFSQLMDLQPATGEIPMSGLTALNGRLYGTTSHSGPLQGGTIFSLKTDGTDYQIIRSFGPDSPEGGDPQGELLAINGRLYGTTSSSGIFQVNGSVFSLNPDGTDFQVIHTFTGTDNLSGAMGSLTLIGNTLYGTTQYGGKGSGCVFAVDLDGANFRHVHDFADAFMGNANEGVGSFGGLLVAGSQLYGLTRRGGAADAGTIFRLDPVLGTFTVIHSFEGFFTPQGGIPNSPLTLKDDRLFGSTGYGGSAALGVLYSLKIDGSDYQVLHNWGSEKVDGGGNLIASGLLFVGDTLFGISSAGGTNVVANQWLGEGLLYTIKTDGSNFTPLHIFGLEATDGKGPWGAPVQLGNTLYGVTIYGGTSKVFGGTVYSWDLTPKLIVPEPIIQFSKIIKPLIPGGPSIPWLHIVTPNLVPGSKYVVEASSDIGAAAWSPVETFTADAATRSWDQPADKGFGFFRIRAL